MKTITDKELMEYYNYKRQGILDIKKNKTNVYFALKFLYLNQKYNLLNLINSVLDNVTVIKKECIVEDENLEKIENLLLKLKFIIENVENVKKVNDDDLAHFFNYKKWTFVKIKEKDKTYKAIMIYYLLKNENMFEKYDKLQLDEVFNAIINECTPKGEVKIKETLEYLKRIQELFIETKKIKINKKRS